ncbi:MAG: acyl-CoA thioester hydrolase/BAAT C-terminal domain-containing protein [Steroidobacteraceae bacterium]
MTVAKKPSWQGHAAAVAALAFSIAASQCAQAADAEIERALPENHGHVDAKLFLGTGTNQPLIVGFGGAEGGNMFASDRVRPGVEQSLKKGYAFLAVGYFDAPGTPKELDRIALEGIHEAIQTAARNPLVNGKCIAVLGASKGGELALLLASHYPDIKAVVGLVPGFAVFVGHTSTLDTPSFSLNGKPLAFVPVPKSAVPFLLPPNRNLRLAWEEMLKDKVAVEKASIAVERINGPILLVSARRDEFWPSTEMSVAIGERLKEHNFPYKFEHVAIDGTHNEVYDHSDLSENFLDANLLQQAAAGCPRSPKK